MNIYLAGPDVFLPDAREIGARKAAICRTHGHTGLFPLDTDIDISRPDASLRIFHSNVAMMDEADAVIANLTPFRGPGADAGTVYELGYMAGKGKRCLAYCNDPTLYAVRIAPVITQPDGRLADTDGLTIENFGHVDNLMMIHALERHGAPLIVPHVRPADIWRDLASFEACVRLAAGTIPQGGH